jgi:hypothetical protein
MSLIDLSSSLASTGQPSLKVLTAMPYFLGCRLVSCFFGEEEDDTLGMSHNSLDEAGSR